VVTHPSCDCGSYETTFGSGRGVNPIAAHPSSGRR
jgi:hypothetical protein